MYSKVKVLLFTTIVMSSFIRMISNSNNDLLYLFTFYSPSPIVFSKRPGLAKIYSKVIFDITTSQGQKYHKVFDRQFYKNLTGPHRFKLIFFSSLNNSLILSEPRNTPHYKKIFCDYEYISNAFQIINKIKRVSIKRKGRVLHEFSCF